MIPVAVLPAAGILLGIGGGLLGGVAAGTFHINSPVALGLLGVMKASGDAVFGALPLMFAIGVAIALSNNDGVAALAAAVGYRAAWRHVRRGQSPRPSDRQPHDVSGVYLFSDGHHRTH
jgi:phosphotransferase system  glucose/maltose/N-acetylglucosamine-specific IIC component